MEQYTKIPVKAIVKFDTSEKIAAEVTLELPAMPSPGDKIKFSREANIPDNVLKYLIDKLATREDDVKKTALGKFIGPDAPSWVWHERARVGLKNALWIVTDVIITPDYIIAEVLYDDIYMLDVL